MLARLDVHLARFSSKIKCEVPLTTQRIGAIGAAEAMAHYVSNYENLKSDPELASFMQFYAQNWRLSASQWSQDIFAMFASNKKRGGTFLEIGAADGFTHSNSYALEKHLGWRGTLVEPEPSQYRALKISRNGNRLLNSAISTTDRDEDLRLRRVGQLSALEGHEGQDMHSQTRRASTEFSKVKGISLTKLLASDKYDYFSLDIEGAELTILGGIDWQKVNKPMIMTVEHNSRPEDKNQIRSLLKNLGYVERFSDHDWLRRGDIWVSLAENR